VEKDRTTSLIVTDEKQQEEEGMQTMTLDANTRRTASFARCWLHHTTPTCGNLHHQQYNTIQYNTKFVKRHVAVASEALANRTVKKHRRRRTNVL